MAMITENSEAVEYRGDTWHQLTVDPKVTFHYAGGDYNVAMPLVPLKVRLADGFKFQMLWDLSSPDFAGVMLDLQAIADANPGERFTITAEIFGRTLNLSGSFRLIDNELAPNFYADKADTIWGS